MLFLVFDPPVGGVDAAGDAVWAFSWFPFVVPFFAVRVDLSSNEVLGVCACGPCPGDDTGGFCLYGADGGGSRAHCVSVILIWDGSTTDNTSVRFGVMVWRIRPDTVTGCPAGSASWPISGLRPRPAAIDPTAEVPPASNLVRHRRTVSAVVAHRRAISLFATPSAANSNPDACTTWRYGNTVDTAIRSNSARSSAHTLNGAAVTIGIHQS